MHDTLKVGRNSLKRWWASEPSTLGAALAFYTIFYLAPVLVMVTFIVGVLYGRQAAEQKLIFDIALVTGPQTANFLEGLITGLVKPQTGIITAVVSGLVIIIGGYFLFHQIQVSLNKIFHSTTKPRAVLTRVGHQLSAFLIVFILGLAVTVSMLLDAAISLARAVLEKYAPNIAGISDLAAYAFPFFLVVLFAASVYRLVSFHPLSFKAALGGGAITGMLFLVGRFFIGWYLALSPIAGGFGAASAAIVILVWIYYSAQIFFFGAACAISIYEYDRRNGEPEASIII